MWVKSVQLEQSIEEKVLGKHGVDKEEMEAALLRDRPKYFKVKGGRYLALAQSNRYLSIIFRYTQGRANVITAYPSSDWQVKLYKEKK